MKLPDSYYSDIEREIIAGLPNEQERRAQNLRNIDYYQMRGAKLIPRRDAETDQDYKIRPKRSLPFTRRVIDVLCSKLYCPGPNRSIVDQDVASEWLDEAYTQNLINSLWQRADRMSTLNGMAAFQVSATGDRSRPIKIQLWTGRHEVVPFEHPDVANEIAAVVTIDHIDNRTRYTWWTEDFYRVYQTDKLLHGQTSGGRASKYVPALSGDNPYGIIPFSFVWYELPINGIDSVEGLGPFLVNLNESIDVEMSDMAQAVQMYHSPIAIAYDADVSWHPIVAPGKWMRVNSVPTDLERGPTPRLEYLQGNLDITGGWTNIRGVIDSQLEALGIPLTAYRMDSNTLPSGAALVAEQKPLMDYAMGRREPFRVYETGLARATLTVARAFYRQPGVTTRGQELILNLTWPAPTIDLPGPDRDTQDQDSLAMGLESRVMIVMRRFGLSRDQAIEHLQQCVEDEQEVTEMGMSLPPKGAAASPDQSEQTAIANGNGKVKAGVLAEDEFPEEAGEQEIADREARENT
jgi:hypothetical protein